VKYLKVREGDKKEVARILKTVPVGATDERGQTALHIACEVDHIAFFFSFFFVKSLYSRKEKERYSSTYWTKRPLWTWLTAVAGQVVSCCSPS
jgi:hypothetical protein